MTGRSACHGAHIFYINISLAIKPVDGCLLSVFGAIVLQLEIRYSRCHNIAETIPFGRRNRNMSETIRVDDQRATGGSEKLSSDMSQRAHIDEMSKKKRPDASGASDSYVLCAR